MYRGFTLEKLKEMSLEQFASLVPSRERRSLLRNLDKVKQFTLRCLKKAEKGKVIRTHLRDIVVVPQLVGLTIAVHNGKEFVPVKITPEMLGHRLGEFSLTRKKVTHSAPGIGATRSTAYLSVK